MSGKIPVKPPVKTPVKDKAIAQDSALRHIQGGVNRGKAVSPAVPITKPQPAPPRKK